MIKAMTAQGIPVTTADEVHEHIGQVKIIDVRTAEEFDGELGHIPTAQLVTLGPTLTQFLKDGDRLEEIVFVCRSGARSGQATFESRQLGYQATVNMIGGMLTWNQKGFPKE